MAYKEKQYNILVVEDNPGDFIIIEDFLIETMMAPLITHVTDFEQAASMISANTTAFDVILLDITLKDKSGQDLVTEMLQITLSTPIIILTGFTDINFSIKSISQGIFDYLLKDDLNATILYKSILYAIERQKSISKLKESEKRYSDLFNLSPQPMWVFNPFTFKFIQVNQAATDLYGYTQQEFLNMTLMDIKPKEDVSLAKKIISERKVDSDIFKQNFTHIIKTGEKIEVEIYSNHVALNDKSYILAVIVDVTEKNLYEQKIVKAIIKTQEDERYEIGGELHDNVCQLLATSQLTLGLIKESIPVERIGFYDQSKEYVSMALDEIRNLSHRLAPAFFDNTTLKEAFERLLNSFNVDKKYAIKLDFDEAVNKHKISTDIHLNLYRILQEQLKNILKYAKASTIEVDVLLDKNNLKMKVVDNGKGFSIDTSKKGIGLANMKRRTELFSGKFVIDSSPGNGCTVLIDIPIS